MAAIGAVSLVLSMSSALSLTSVVASSGTTQQIVVAEFGVAEEMYTDTGRAASWLGRSDEQLVGMEMASSELVLSTASWTASSLRLLETSLGAETGVAESPSR
jgi:hypothetical protein